MNSDQFDHNENVAPNSYATMRMQEILSDLNAQVMKSIEPIFSKISQQFMAEMDQIPGLQELGQQASQEMSKSTEGMSAAVAREMQYSALDGLTDVLSDQMSGFYSQFSEQLHPVIESTVRNDISLKLSETVAQTMPNFFDRDGKFDIDAFREELESEEVDFTHEGYRLDFAGKSFANYLTGLATSTVLVPSTEHNNDERNLDSRNLYVIGDNLDAIKHLRRSYQGEIKCIYVDPPYNTGKDGFTYNDTFGLNEEYLTNKVGLSPEDAARTIRLHGSASHSAWLSFMYPRLKLAEDLLTDDGAIFISIDHNEQANLHILCNAIFGEQNYLGTITWKNATDNNPTQVAIEHEYILVYCKNKAEVAEEWKSPDSEIKDVLVAKGDELITRYSDPEELQEAYTKWHRDNKNQLGNLERYKYIDVDGVYIGSQSVHNPGKEGYRYDVIHPVTKKPTRQPLRGYRFSKSTMDSLLEEGRILFGEDENKIIELKVYARDYQEKLPSIINMDGRLGPNEISDLFDKHKVFTNPKPSELIEMLFSYLLENDDIALDFFSGSASSAHAVMNLNARDNGSRRYIMVQLPEEVSKDTGDALALGYETIDQVGRARIEKAADRIRETTDAEIDYGYKVFTAQDPSSVSLETIQEFTPDALFGTTNSYLDDLGTDTASGTDIVLTTWLNQDQFGLTPEVTKHHLHDYDLYRSGKSVYIVDEGMTTDDVTVLIEHIETGALDINRIVYLPYVVDFEVQQGLELNLKYLRNGRDISLIRRG